MGDRAPEPQTILKLGSAAFPAFAMIAGMQLELFTPLAAGPMRPEQLAAALGLPPAKLKPLLYALVSAGLLTLSDDGKFANTPEADQFLVRGKPTYLGDRHLHYVSRYEEAMQTASTIRSGRPQAKKDFASMSADALEKMLRGLNPAAKASGRALVSRADFSSRRRLADVGGGAGGLALAIAAACPELHVTVIDLPAVLPIARRFIAEEGMTERAEAVACDVVRGPIPGRYDGAVLRSLIQVLSPEEARHVLRNLIQALEPGSPIYIIGQMLDDSRLSPAETVSFNLVFLNIYDEGQAYTESEYRTWLTEAGFTGIERSRLAEASLITARKPF